MAERDSWPGRVGRFMVETAVDAAGRTAMFVARDAGGKNGIVKVVPKPKGADPDPLRGERFMEEAAELRALQHPGLVPILDAGVMDDCYYLVLERIDGCSLAELLDDCGVVDIGSLMAIALEVGDTLSKLHDLNVTVRDLEPSNVVIDQLGRAVIAGVALSALTRLQRTQSVLGVPGYVAPELLLGLSPSPLSDQFSYGRMLLTLAGANHPVAIDPAQPLKPQLSADTVDWSRYPDEPGYALLAPIIERLTAPRAAERYPAIADALQELVEVALQLGPEEELDDRTMPMMAVSAPTTPAPVVSRTRSIVIASGRGLDLHVEEYEPVAETTASHRILPSLRAQAERHLAARGSRELSSHAGLPQLSTTVEPATVRQRLPADDDDELIETVVPERDRSALQSYAAADTIPNARLPSRRRAAPAEVETIVPKTGPMSPLPGERDDTLPPKGPAERRSTTTPGGVSAELEALAKLPTQPKQRSAGALGVREGEALARASTRPDAPANEARARTATRPDAPAPVDPRDPRSGEAAAWESTQPGAESGDAEGRRAGTAWDRARRKIRDPERRDTAKPRTPEPLDGATKAGPNADAPAWDTTRPGGPANAEPSEDAPAWDTTRPGGPGASAGSGTPSPARDSKTPLRAGSLEPLPLANAPGFDPTRPDGVPVVDKPRPGSLAPLTLANAPGWEKTRPGVASPLAEMEQAVPVANAPAWDTTRPGAPPRSAPPPKEDPAAPFEPDPSAAPIAPGPAPEPLNLADDLDVRATPPAGTRAAPSRGDTTTDRVPPRAPGFRWGVFVATVVVAAAAVWGVWMLMRQVERASTLPDVLPLTTKGEPRYRFYGQVPVEPQVVRRARNYYVRARRALEDNRTEEAERDLGICVEIADLPECHRTLAALLSLKQDPAAAAHLERYLQTTPDPDLAARMPSQ